MGSQCYRSTGRGHERKAAPTRLPHSIGAAECGPDVQLFPGRRVRGNGQLAPVCAMADCLATVAVEVTRDPALDVVPAVPHRVPGVGPGQGRVGAGLVPAALQLVLDLVELLAAVLALGVLAVLVGRLDRSTRVRRCNTARSCTRTVASSRYREWTVSTPSRHASPDTRAAWRDSAPRNTDSLAQTCTWRRARVSAV